MKGVLRCKKQPWNCKVGVSANSPTLFLACHCRFDPLWNSLVIGGVEDGKPFLGTVGMIGTSYSSSHIATGNPLRCTLRHCLKLWETGCDPATLSEIMGDRFVKRGCGLSARWSSRWRTQPLFCKLEGYVASIPPHNNVYLLHMHQPAH